MREFGSFGDTKAGIMANTVTFLSTLRQGHADPSTSVLLRCSTYQVLPFAGAQTCARITQSSTRGSHSPSFRNPSEPMIGRQGITTIQLWACSTQGLWPLWVGAAYEALLVLDPSNEEQCSQKRTASDPRHRWGC